MPVNMRNPGIIKEVTDVIMFIIKYLRKEKGGNSIEE